MTQFVIEVLDQRHARISFSCGVKALDRYFHQQVSQDIKRRATACYVAVDSTSKKVAGYYTLAAGGIALSDLPEAFAKKLPRYPSVPVARLGRLAVDQSYRGQKLGGVLLWDAIARVLRSDIAVYALVVDAKDEQAESFYLHYGFVKFGSLPNQLMLPLANIPTKH